MKNNKKYIIQSNAKINLFLKIIGKNSKNYHLLESLVVFAKDIFDIIEVQIDKKNNLNIIYDENLNNKNIDIENNLITKVIAYFQRNYNIKDYFNITLYKNIPIGAGLGGGSGNVAKMILFFNKCYNLKLKRKDLMQIGSIFGADVAMCLTSNPCICKGVGDILFDYDKILDNYYILLINPNKFCSTKEVFHNYKLNSIKVEHDYSIANTSFIDLLNNVDNDLLPIVDDLFNNLASNIINSIKHTKGLIHTSMSGSGLTCFGLYSNLDDMLFAKNQLQKEYPYYWINGSKIIN